MMTVGDDVKFKVLLLLQGLSAITNSINVISSLTSLSGLVAHSRDSKGDLDMMVALVCMMGLKDHT